MTTGSIQPPRNPLAAVLVDTLRRLRRARLCLQLARERHRAVADALHIAVAMLAERDRELDRLRARYHSLLAEHRAAQQRPAA